MLGTLLANAKSRTRGFYFPSSSLKTSSSGGTMFRNLSLVVFTSMFVISAYHSNADTLPVVKTILLGAAYVPSGFDDNDRIQLVVEGLLPNTCYRVGPHSISVSDSSRTIAVEQQVYHYLGGVCFQMMVPFHQVVDVGLIKAGRYSIADKISAKVLGSLDVLRAKNAGPDDYLYAPVTDAYLESDTQSKKTNLILTGSFTDRCSMFDDVQVQYQNHVLVVLPIMKRVEGRCVPEKAMYTKVVELDQELHGAYMLHVRSLNGQAINRVVDLE